MIDDSGTIVVGAKNAPPTASCGSCTRCDVGHVPEGEKERRAVRLLDLVIATGEFESSSVSLTVAVAVVVDVIIDSVIAPLAVSVIREGVEISEAVRVHVDD